MAFGAVTEQERMRSKTAANSLTPAAEATWLDQSRPASQPSRSNEVSVRKLHRYVARMLGTLGLDPATPPSRRHWALFLEGISKTLQRMNGSSVIAAASSIPAADPAAVTRLPPGADETVRLREMFEMAPLSMFRVELNGEISMANQRMQRLLGYTGEEIRTAGSELSFVHPADRAQAIQTFNALREGHTGSSSEGHRRLVHKNGTIVHAKVTASVICDDAGRPQFTVVIVEDVSTRIGVEVELRQAQKLESVGRLASGIAHELNTPMQYIGDNTSFLQSAYADLIDLCDAYRAILQTFAEGLSVEQRTTLAAAEEIADLDYLRGHGGPAFAATMDGVARVATIVGAMRTFAQPDNGRTAIDINAALRNTLIVATNELKDVADVAVAFGELPPIECQLGALNQVFLNLLVNASHAIADVTPSPSDRGNSPPKGKIGVRTFREGASVVVSISDTGTGIADHIRERIFEPFFTTKEVGRGTGQGLAVARSVVEKHGGTLTFETELGRGTTFFVRLPAGDGGSAPAGTTAPPLAPE